MIKVCCGVTLCNVTASHIQKQRPTTAPYKTHHRGCFSSPGGDRREKKYIDYLKATQYNLFVSLFFLRNFSWSVDLLGNGPSCHWMGRLEIHVANKGVVLPRQKLFISLAESCCGQESVLLGWNKSSTWFQDNLPLWQTATWEFVKKTYENNKINKYSTVLLMLFTTWWQVFVFLGGCEFLVLVVFLKTEANSAGYVAFLFVRCIIALLY